MTKRQTKRIHVVEERSDERKWPPTNALACIGWFQSMLAQVPAEYRDKAVVEISGHESYGDGYARIEMYFDRPETDEEMAARIEHEDRNRQTAMRSASLQLERYRKQFPELFEK